MNQCLTDELDTEERCDDRYDGNISASERRVLLTHWLGKAHDDLDPDYIRKCFQKTGCCLDMNGKENHLIKLAQLKTFVPPKKGDSKMKKLTVQRKNLKCGNSKRFSLKREELWMNWKEIRVILRKSAAAKNRCL